MTTYNAVQDYQETKKFEVYLLIQNRIINECKNGIQETLLQKLTQMYQAGGKENDLMTVLQLVKN